MFKKGLILLLSICYLSANATHNRSGEITYQHVSGFTYKITVTAYTKESSAAADKCEIMVHFGDNDSAIVTRTNGPLGSPCSPGIGNGESLGGDIKKNVYETTHTYSGNGTYVITMNDPNRNESICNIPNSVSISFYLRSELVINPFLGDNSSPVLLNPPIDNACVGECFEHNPGAFDADGDSLSYSLVSSYANGSPIAGYTFPPNLTDNDIDALRGDLRWCAPSTVCEYNIAILIEEYRKLPGSRTRYYIGSVLRDIQIVVGSCFNEKPQIEIVNDTAIAIGEILRLNIRATDNNGDSLHYTVAGGPLNITPKANFNSTPSQSLATGTFSWTPDCSLVRLMPYLVTFKISDDNTDQLVDYESVLITVLPDTCDIDFDFGPDTGTGSLASSRNISIFPNPASTVLNIELPDIENYRLTVYDFLGKQLMQLENAKSLNLEGLENGIYLLKINYNNRIVSKRFVISK